MSIVLETFSGDMLGAHWLFNDLEIPSMKSSYFSLAVFLNLFIYLFIITSYAEIIIIVDVDSTQDKHTQKLAEP